MDRARRYREAIRRDHDGYSRLPVMQGEFEAVLGDAKMAEIARGEIWMFSFPKPDKKWSRSRADSTGYTFPHDSKNGRSGKTAVKKQELQGLGFNSRRLHQLAAGLRLLGEIAIVGG